MIVVFDRYSSSPKDNDHLRRTKESCFGFNIKPNIIHRAVKAKYLDNTYDIKN